VKTVISTSLMKVTKIICDVCRQDVSNQTDWEDDPHPLKFSNWTGSANPMGAITGGHQQSDFVSNDTCSECSRLIAKAVRQTIEARRTLVNEPPP